MGILVGIRREVRREQEASAGMGVKDRKSKEGWEGDFYRYKPLFSNEYYKANQIIIHFFLRVIKVCFNSPGSRREIRLIRAAVFFRSSTQPLLLTSYNLPSPISNPIPHLNNTFLLLLLFLNITNTAISTNWFNTSMFHNLL